MVIFHSYVKLPEGNIKYPHVGPPKEQIQIRFLDRIHCLICTYWCWVYSHFCWSCSLFPWLFLHSAAFQIQVISCKLIYVDINCRFIIFISTSPTYSKIISEFMWPGRFFGRNSWKCCPTWVDVGTRTSVNVVLNSVRKPWENWIFQVLNDTTHWKMLWWSLERFGHDFCEWSAMQSCFGPVSGTFLRTFGLKNGKHRSFKKPPFAMATKNFHAELLNGRRIAIPIPLDMTIRELKEELKVWQWRPFWGLLFVFGAEKKDKQNCFRRVSITVIYIGYISGLGTEL